MITRLRGAGFFLVAVYLLLVAVLALDLGHVTGDTTQLVAGVQLLESCVRSGAWTACRDFTVPGGSVFPYAPLQYLPAVVFAFAGLNDTEMISALRTLNLGAFGLTMALTYCAVRRRAGAALATVGVVAVFLSSAIYQATSGFGEMLSALLGVALVASCIYRRPALIVLTAAVAVLMKDTAAPFLYALGVLAGRDLDDGRLPPRRVLVPLSSGVAAGALAAGAFNQLRMGTWRNSFYLNERFRTPTELVPEFWWTQWLSPSGGLLWYWPITTLLLVTAASSCLIRIHQQPGEFHQWLPQAGLVALIVGWTVGLSFWWTPFGWTTVGPRLAVPLLPAFTVLALILSEQHLRAIARRARAAAPVAVAAAGALALVFTPLPWDWNRALTALEAATPGCPPLYENILGTERYYECARQTLRRRELTVLAPRTTLRDAWPGVLVGTASVLLLAASIALDRRRNIAYEDEPRPSTTRQTSSDV